MKIATARSASMVSKKGRVMRGLPGETACSIKW